MIKKNATLTGVVLMFTLCIGIFTGMFIWMNKAGEDSGAVIDNKYSMVYSNYTIQRDNMNTKLEEIRDNVKGVTEPDNLAQVAINGFKGLGNVLLLPIAFVDYILNTLYATNTILEIPSWAKMLLGMALLGFIIILIIKSLKGEQSY